MCRLTGCQQIALEARFLKYVRPLPSGCLIWTGAQTSGGFAAKGKSKSRGGPYGSFKVGKDAEGKNHGTRRAHIVWAFLRGRIPTLRVPEGHHLDHTCKSGTLCIECTELVPSLVNLQRNWSKGHAHNAPNKQDRSTAATIVREVAAERRARLVATKRKRARRRRSALSGNSKRRTSATAG